MNALNNYITFLQEYKKLLERGVKDIFIKRVSPSFIWIDDIQKLINENLCETILTNLFIEKCDSSKSIIFTLSKPLKPQINIPFEFSGAIEFNDAKNKFESENENDLIAFKNSNAGIEENKKIQTFISNKAIYSKLYRVFNDIKNDSNIEIVLSVGLIQYSKQGKTNSISKTNQHLFHFPLKIELTTSNKINLSFSNTDKPYADFFFLNNAPIEKSILNNIVDRFEEEVDTNGFQYIYEDGFKDILSEKLQQISENSIFENSILKPVSDTVNVDSFKFSFSPSINIKKQKPRFFDKLTKGIIDYNEKQENDAELFNLLIRNPNNEHTNLYVKSNYFKDDLYEEYKENNSNLTAQDFSVFFPLPYNKEQKKIYDNYLKNRITVVTGPPGTGKSHTIVNILCTLLAQGKRVLVTAQTDKALESLLDKIPPTFDDLIFTKIQVETDKTRFSLDKSINNIRSILIDDFHLNIENKISILNTLKGEYLQFKLEIYKVLEKEYNEISLNESFNNLKSYKLWDKLQSKTGENWNWLKDEISLEEINDFSTLKSNINDYIKLSDYKNSVLKNVDIDLMSISNKINTFNFSDFLNSKNKIEELKKQLNIKDYLKAKLLEIDIDAIIKITENYSNSDIIINNYQQISQLKNKTKKNNEIIEDYISNLKYSEIVENSSKYLRDIESYLAQIENDKEKISFFNKFKGKYKQVNYLENIVLNSENCDNKNSLKQLKFYLKKIQKIQLELNVFTKLGFNILINEDSDLSSKNQLLNDAIEQVERNHTLVYILKNNKDIITFSKTFNIEISNIEEIYNTSVSYKEDLEKLKQLDLSMKKDLLNLKEISNTLCESKLFNEFKNFIPLEKISEIVTFKKFERRLEGLFSKIEKEVQFNKSLLYLKEKIPKTLPKLKQIPSQYITKENIEFAHANNYFLKNEDIDLQKTKEKLSQINNKIYELKCEILFDLAKNNFKNNFNPNQIDKFINLLEDYKTNLYQGSRGIKDKVKFQILARKNSAKISNNLSCWVMKFNDVLNSVGTEPEIFDCIIVDEASQLDFNSLILGYYAKNMIIVGDDKQTSPSSLTGADSNDFDAIKNKYLEFLGDNRIQIRSDESLFSLSKKTAGSSSLTLKEHFRCVSEIIEFSKFYFYNNILKPLKQINTDNRLESIKAVFVKNSFLETQIAYTEIESIKNYLIEIIKNPIYQNKTIGVVSLGLAKHTEKLKDIKEDLAEIFGGDKLDKIKLIIEDSPKFQGDERDVMLVSLGVALDSEKLKSNENPKPRAIIDDGNLKDDLKKINVALSRAKEQMILFHSVKSENLSNNDFRLKILSFFYNETKKLKPFELPEDQGERDIYNRPKPFDSWFEYDITSELINKGYPYIEPQYKVKEDETFYNHHLQKETYVNFKLDLVVSNNGKMVAIECDGDPFHSLPEDVAYDVERQEFLERVGWKVYRILYSAYKRNPSDEIEKMVDYIEINTKKDKTTTLSEVYENEIKEEVTEVFIEEAPLIIPLSKHKSYIDKLENESYPIQEKEEFEDTNNIEEDKIVRYFNLNLDGIYHLEQNENPSTAFSIPIKQSDKNGYLLQGYDNGHINKVLISTLLSKQINREYKNGLNIKAKLLFLKIIKKEEIIGIHFNEGGNQKFKAHLTKNISSREQLHLQGYKVVYNDFTNLKYQILPLKLFSQIERVVYQSFTAVGKAIDNSNYVNEWRILNIKKDLELPFNSK
ncbi:AAA family ATPase [Tenacibaculum finnmarkense]|uniref:AAA family ATPase n=1 Tax=Tenacibaculum finnmarkense TaxID=2781243 RepID=UPI001EFA941D|nr:AAA family ATPase [Tenacibaculum finnmarkense]MCG8761308.1 AAA family ATPase [Tenacibaculum finnmarkense]MCG8786682.1 AAA family ATPase [Tenacibaculum finnmarkense]